ncbi:MAG TPA: ABC transporter substrate-binding protein [Natronosporangium sp.]
MLDIAAERGYFDEENLSVTVQPGLGTGRNLQQLAAGTAQLAQLDTMSAFTEYSKTLTGFQYQQRDETDQGYDNFVLVSLLHRSLMAAIVAKASSGIERPRDLHAKSVGVIPGGAPFTLFRGLGVAGRMNPDDVQLVPAEGSLLNDMLRTGQVDATVSFVGEIPTIEQAIGEPVSVIRYADYMADALGSSWGATREFVDANPDVVRRFNRAVLRGLAVAAADPREAGRIWYRRHRDLQDWTEELAIRSCELVAGYFQPVAGKPLGYLDDTLLARGLALLVSLGQAHEALQLSTIVRPEFVE